MGFDHDFSVRTWDLATGAEIARLDRHRTAVKVCSLSAGGACLLSASGEVVVVSDAENGLVIGELTRERGPGGRFCSASFSADGERVVVATQDGKVSSWWFRSGRLDSMVEFRSALQELVLAANGSRCAPRFDHMQDASLRNGQPLSIIGAAGEQLELGAEGWPSSFSPEGRLFASWRKSPGAEQVVFQVWDAVSGELLWESKALPGDFGWCVPSDGERFVCFTRGSHSGAAWYLDLTAGGNVEPLEGYEQEGVARVGVASRVVNRDGTLLAVGYEDGLVRLWKLGQRTEIGRFVGHSAAVPDGRFSRDGRLLLTASKDGTLRVWDTRAAAARPRPRHSRPPVVSCAWSSGGSQLASGGRDEIFLWDAKTFRHVGSLVNENDVNEVDTLAFDPRGDRLYSTSWQPQVWDLAERRALAPLPGTCGNQNVGSFDAARTRMTAMTSDGKRVGVWDLRDSSLVRSIDPGEHVVLCCSLSPDARRLVTATSAVPVLWDLTTGGAVARLAGHEDRVTSLAFSPDGELLLTGCYDGAPTIRLWDGRTGAPLGSFRIEGPGVRQLSVSPGLRWVAYVLASFDLVVVDRESKGAVWVYPGASAHAWHPAEERLAVGTADGELHVVALEPRGVAAR